MMPLAASAPLTVTPVLLDVLRGGGLDATRLVHRHVARLRRDGLLGWQPFVPGRGETGLDRGRHRLTSLCLRQNHLGAEVMVGDNMHVSAEGDIAVVTITGALPEAVILALTGRPFTAVADCGILAGGENLIVCGTALTSAGRTWLSVRAPGVTLPLRSPGLRCSGSADA